MAAIDANLDIQKLIVKAKVKVKVKVKMVYKILKMTNGEPTKVNESSEKGALSLLYDGKNAPNVSIKGYQHLAEEIVRHAKDNNLLVHSDPELFRRLEHLEQGQSIPPNLYVVIAELIAFSYVLRGKFPDSWQ